MSIIEGGAYEAIAALDPGDAYGDVQAFARGSQGEVENVVSNSMSLKPLVALDCFNCFGECTRYLFKDRDGGDAMISSPTSGGLA